MKVTTLIYLIFITLSFSSFSQEILTIKTGEENIKKLSVSSKIIGDISVTTFDMLFYNPK